MTGARRIRIGPVHCGGAAPCGDVGWRKRRRKRPAPRRAHRRGAQGNGGETGKDGPRARTRRRRSRRAGRRRRGAGDGGGRSGGGLASSGERHERTTNSARASSPGVADAADKGDALNPTYRAIFRPVGIGKRRHDPCGGRVGGAPFETPRRGDVRRGRRPGDRKTTPPARRETRAPPKRNATGLLDGATVRTRWGAARRRVRPARRPLRAAHSPDRPKGQGQGSRGANCG